jgi:hypothetical protein
MKSFEINQVVYGVRCGQFIILGFRNIGGEMCADCKALGPNGELGRGEICMPLDCIQSSPRA